MKISTMKLLFLALLPMPFYIHGQSIDSSQIEFTHSVGTSETRTVKGRMSEVFYATDYGVVVDNPNIDATTKLKNAIDAAKYVGGGTVILPAGTIYVDTIDYIESNIKLVGQGVGTTTLKLSDDKYGDVIQITGEKAQIVLEDFTIDANGNRSQEITSNGIHIKSSKNIFINRIEIVNARNNGIAISWEVIGSEKKGCEDINITSTLIDRTYFAHGISIDRSKNVYISGNTIRNPMESGIQNYHSDYIRIVDNHIENNMGEGQGFGGVRVTSSDSIEAALYINVSGNTIKGMDRGVFFNSDVQYSTITNNIIDSAWRTGILVQDAKHITILGNNIRNPSTSIAGKWNGITLNSVQKSIVSSNKVTDDRSILKMKWGISEQNQTGSQASSNNLVIGNWVSSGTSGYINVEGTGSKVIANIP